MPLPADNIAYYQGERDRALARGDINQANAISADLKRWGVRAETNGKQQRRGRGRPPKPRCEHGRIVGRCNACEQAEIDETRPNGSEG